MLHGREVERATIDGLLARAEAGDGGALVLRGEAGSGKSRLLDYAAERARAFRVLRTAGIEAESELAYAGLHQLIWPLLPRVGQLQPPQAAALGAALGLEQGDEPDRFLVSVALLTLLSEAAEEQAIVCLIDDVRLLDRPSIDALLFVARRLAGERVAMLATDGSDPSPFEAPGIPQLHLAPLDTGATAGLVADLAAVSVDAQVARRLADGTAGNPLALTELARLLKPDQLSGAASLPDPIPIGNALERAMLERVHRLPDQARRLLLIAAAADSPDLVPIMAAARRLDVPADALLPAEAAHLVRALNGEIDFAPRVRAAVYYDATSAARREAHGALAAVLDAQSDAERRAWHHAAAVVEPDEDVARELEETAERARRRGALAAVASALRRAAELTPDAHTRGRRLAAAGRAAYLAGQAAVAEALLREADPLLGDPMERAQSALTLGEISLMDADAERSIGTLTRGADEIAETHPSLALDLLVPAAVVVSECRCGDAEGILRRSEALVGGGGDPPAVAFVRSNTRLAARGLAGGGRLEAFIPSEPFDHMPSRRFWIGLMTAHPATGVEVSDSIAFLSSIAAACREQGLAGRLGAVLAALSYGEFQAGRFSAALADASEALELSRDDGRELGIRVAAGVLALLAAVQGRSDDCRQFAADAMPRSDGNVAWTHHALSLWARGLLALGTDDPETALVDLTPIRPGGPVEQPWVTPLATPDYVEAAMSAGQADAARAAAQQLRSWVRRAHPSWGMAAIARCTAMIAEDPHRAAEAYEEALRHHESIDRAFMRARTRLLYGELLRRTHRRVQAREQLRLALQTFEHVGAEPWSERARRELRASGQTLRRRTPQALNLLTPQELQIARFVARGGTNKEVAAQLFLSPRTVAAHLRSIFRKLGIATRTELAQHDFESGEVAPTAEPDAQT